MRKLFGASYDNTGHFMRYPTRSRLDRGGFTRAGFRPIKRMVTGGTWDRPRIGGAWDLHSGRYLPVRARVRYTPKHDVYTILGFRPIRRMRRHEE